MEKIVCFFHDGVRLRPSVYRRKKALNIQAYSPQSKAVECEEPLRRQMLSNAHCYFYFHFKSFLLRIIYKAERGKARAQKSRGWKKTNKKAFSNAPSFLYILGMKESRVGFLFFSFASFLPNVNKPSWL